MPSPSPSRLPHQFVDDGPLVSADGALLAGGASTREPFRLGDTNNTFAHLTSGVGAEYLLTSRLGLSASVTNRYFFSDNLDFVNRGRYNDFYWTGRLEATLYIGRQRGTSVVR